MEHIVQFAIGIDDNAIKERIEKNVESEVIKTITKKIEEVIYQRGYYYQDDKTPLRNMVKERIDMILAEEKDNILQMASTILADKLFRSKKGKELLAQFEAQEDE